MNIIPKGKDKILSVIHDHGPLHYSAIMQRTGLTNNTALKHLRSLETDGVVWFEARDGKVFWGLTDAPHTIALRAVLESLKVKDLPYIGKVYEYLAEARPLVAVLFPQPMHTLEETAGLMLVYDKQRKTESREIDLGIPVTLLPILTAWLSRKSRLRSIQYALDNGIVLVGREYFYQKVTTKK